jgi:hypothetical protein
MARKANFISWRCLLFRLDELRVYLATVPAGAIDDAQKIEQLLADSWEELAGNQGGMAADKLYGRTENMEWQPPLLRFEIERHGARKFGSTWAEIQSWKVDVEKGQATVTPSELNRKRLVGQRLPPLDVKPIAQETVNLILAGKSDERLKWYGETKFKIIIGKLFPPSSACKQTLAGRRKRFSRVIHEDLVHHGWHQVGTHTYEKGKR